MSDRGEAVRDYLEVLWRRLRADEPGLRDWTFRINKRCRVRLGQCRYDRSVIEVSEWALADAGVAADTLFHEAAHALVGPRVGHGPAWKREAARLGASPRGCATGAELKALDVPRHRWMLRCSACGATYPRHRRDRRLAGRRCSCGRGRYAYHENPRERPA